MSLPSTRPVSRAAALQETLFRIFEILAVPGDLRTQLAAIHQVLWPVIDASNLYVAIFDESSGLYFFPYNADEDDDDHAPAELRKSLTDYVRRTGRPLLCTEATHQSLRAQGEVVSIGIPAPMWLGAPLHTSRGSIGAVVVQSYVDDQAYDESDIETLVLVARSMAIAIERQWTTERTARAAEMRLGELQLSRDEALRASQEKTRFLANMSHELRTPLNAILGYTDLLLEDLTEPDVVSDLGSIRSSAVHLRELIDGVLDLTQVESGRLEVYPSEFTITSLFDAIGEQVAPLLRQGDNLLKRVGEGTAGTLFTDRRALFQIVLNLVGNACKFTRNGQIVLRARRIPWPDGEAVQFEVSDTGIGIDPAVLPTLFEPFTQVDSSSTRSQGGSGLGLAIARRLAGRLGGDIEGASVPGRGTTFVVRIPQLRP